MNAEFNIKRVGWILRADWKEYTKLISLAVCMIVPSLLVMRSGTEPSQFTGLWFGFFLTLLVYQNYANQKIHHSKGLWLTLPATTLEKYVALLIAGIAYVSAFLLLFHLVRFVLYLLQDVPIYSMKQLAEPLKGFGFITLHFAYCLMITTIFRKNALGAAFLIEALFLGGLAFIVDYLMNGHWEIYTMGSVFHVFDALYYILGQQADIIFYLFALLFFYIGYVQLKKQQR
ncbi:hypothetical protein LJC54_10600 [Parabacteroides sp. OttesenSCG-928-J18]|nr:hypothetical protein [Parabacteroides sp. OttesenSCG-928-J18]